MIELPDRIYLQVEEHPEITWCVDQIHETDVEYRRVLPEEREDDTFPGAKVLAEHHRRKET